MTEGRYIYDRAGAILAAACDRPSAGADLPRRSNRWFGTQASADRNLLFSLLPAAGDQWAVGRRKLPGEVEPDPRSEDSYRDDWLSRGVRAWRCRLEFGNDGVRRWRPHLQQGLSKGLLR